MAAADIEHEAARDLPEHAHEREQQNRRLQQPDAEIGRQLGQVARILVHALVGVVADGTGVGEPERAAGLQPVPDEIVGEPGAQLQFQRLAEPALPDVQHQQAAGDDGEHAELQDELVQITARQRVVEGLVPAVEPDLAVGRGGDDHEDRQPEQQQPVAHRRGQ